LNAVIRIGNDNNAESNPVCGTVTSDMLGESGNLEIVCENAMVGSHISIHLPGQGYLQLCEVMAYASTECEDTVEGKDHL